MKSKSKHQGLKRTIQALACVLSLPALAADVTLHVRADLPAVNQLSKSTYGGGLHYTNADVRVMFENKFWDGTAANSLASYNMLKSLNMGMYRFPGGDPSFWYRWDKPCGSVRPSDVSAADFANQCVEFLGMADIQKYLVAPTLPQGAPYRAPLGAQAMYQVNTVQAWNLGTDGKTKWHTVYRRIDWQDAVTQEWKSRPDVQTGRYEIDPDGLSNVAAAAAAWVKRNRDQYGTAQQAQYWEIGNEDWVRWTPEQYAEIFIAFANAMIQANGGTVNANGNNAPLKLIAQTSTIAKDYSNGATVSGTNNLAINQTAGVDWLLNFAMELKRRNYPLTNVYGVAPHPYLDGDRSPDINVRTLTMFLKAEGEEMLDTYWLVANLNGFYKTKWKILNTEYNIKEFEQTDLAGNAIPYQNKANALVLADWTARMLSTGVEKVMPHNLEADPRMGLFLYRNQGTLEAPKLTAPGAAFARVASALQGAMYKTENDATNITFAGVSGTAQVKSLSSYATINGNTLSLLLINRNLSQPQTVTLKLSGGRQFVVGGTLKRNAFGENRTLLDHNFDSQLVTWGNTTFASYQESCFTPSGDPKTCVPTTTVPAGGMVHVTVPLVPLQ